jgi:hypothetical protein
MIPIEERLSLLKRKKEDLQSQKIQTETRLHTLEEDKLKLLEECIALGVDPQNLEKEIQERELKLASELDLLGKEIELLYERLADFRI